MIICLGEEEFELEELMAQTKRDIERLDTALVEIGSLRDQKLSALEMLRKWQSETDSGSNQTSDPGTKLRCI